MSSHPDWCGDDWDAALADRDQRISELEAQCAAMREALKGYERWEADMLLSEPAWAGGCAPLPRLTQELWDSLLVLQSQRNAALATDAGKAMLERLENYRQGCADLVTAELARQLEYRGPIHVVMEARDIALAEAKRLREALEEIRPDCEQCGASATRMFRTEGDGPYWLCDSTDAEHGEEFYCGEEVELPKLRAALAPHPAPEAERAAALAATGGTEG